MEGSGGVCYPLIPFALAYSRVGRGCGKWDVPCPLSVSVECPWEVSQKKDGADGPVFVIDVNTVIALTTFKDCRISFTLYAETFLPILHLSYSGNFRYVFRVNSSVLLCSTRYLVLFRKSRTRNERTTIPLRAIPSSKAIPAPVGGADDAAPDVFVRGTIDLGLFGLPGRCRIKVANDLHPSAYAFSPLLHDAHPPPSRPGKGWTPLPSETGYQVWKHTYSLPLKGL